MPKTILPIADGYYETGSLPVSSQNCVNLYPIIEDEGALSPETLRATPGVTLILADPIVLPDDPDAPLPDKDEDSGLGGGEEGGGEEGGGEEGGGGIIIIPPIEGGGE